MADGWKQLIDDLRGALGLPVPAGQPRKDDKPPAPSPSPPTPSELPNHGSQHPASCAPAAGLSVVRTADGAPTPIPSTTEGEVISVAPQEAAILGDAESTKPLTLLQKLYSYAGLAATLLVAIGFGWYVYFGGPRPPAPDVVATFDGGQITVEQLRGHLARLTPLIHPAVDGSEPVSIQSYEGYRAVASHMVLNELVRRWAGEQQLDREAKFADAMRHVSESLTLDEWVAELHKSDMMGAVRENDIQAYYEANKDTLGDVTLSEVREKIRETLAHQNEEQFLEDYIARLRADATIVRAYELLEVPPPTEEQIRDYYKANLAQFTEPQRAVVDVIYVPPASFGDEADAAARAKAEAARSALNTGNDVGEVAAQYSQTPYSTVGVMVEAGKDDSALIEQAFALTDEGDLSPIFRTQAGYYVLRLREQQPTSTLSLDEARAQITDALRGENERAWFERNADRTLLTIHGERYTLGQFYHEFQNLPAELQTQYAGPEGMRQLADLLIDRLLVLDDAYNRLLDQENAPLLEEIRIIVLRQMMHEAEVDKQVAVSDQEIKDYYEQHKELFASPPEARIRTIRVYRGQTEGDYQRAWDRAEAAYKTLAPGLGAQPAEFDVVAKEYDESEKDSTDAGLGEWVRMEDDLLQNLSAHPLHSYLLSLPAGSVSQPFEFGDSLYIVKILERSEPVPLTFEQVKDFLRGELEAIQHQQLDAQLAERLLRDAHVAIYDEVILQALESDAAMQNSP